MLRTLDILQCCARSQHVGHGRRPLRCSLAYPRPPPPAFPRLHTQASLDAMEAMRAAAHRHARYQRRLTSPVVSSHSTSGQHFHGGASEAHSYGSSRASARSGKWSRRRGLDGSSVHLRHYNEQQRRQMLSPPQPAPSGHLAPTFSPITRVDTSDRSGKSVDGAGTHSFTHSLGSVAASCDYDVDAGGAAGPRAAAVSTSTAVEVAALAAGQQRELQGGMAIFSDGESDTTDDELAELDFLRKALCRLVPCGWLSIACFFVRSAFHVALRAECLCRALCLVALSAPATFVVHLCPALRLGPQSRKQNEVGCPPGCRCDGNDCICVRQGLECHSMICGCTGACSVHGQPTTDVLQTMYRSLSPKTPVAFRRMCGMH